jgi:hypothetical protein
LGNLKEERMVVFRRVSWKEGNDLASPSKTYNGLWLDDPVLGQILVCELSHGLRVLAIRGNEDRYQINPRSLLDNVNLVEAPNDFYLAVKEALRADQHFQSFQQQFRDLYLRR